MLMAPAGCIKPQSVHQHSPLKVNFIELATRIMTGFPVHAAIIQPMDIDYVACKCPMFSFGRLKNSDPRLGVEMSSTGEVACFGVNVHEAFLKGTLTTVGYALESCSRLCSIVQTMSKPPGNPMNDWASLTSSYLSLFKDPVFFWKGGLQVVCYMLNN